MAIPKLELKDLTNQQRLSSGIDKINADQLSAVLAQKARSVGQAANELTEKGIGKFGMDYKKLEQTGYLKPGIVDRMLKKGQTTENILQCTSAWTGKNGIKNVSQVLSSETIQSDIMFESYDDAFAQLKSLGAIKEYTSPAEMSSLLSIASDFSPAKALDWAGGKITDAVEGLQMSSLADGANYAVNFIDTKVESLFSSVGDIAGNIGKGVGDIAGGIGKGLESLTDGDFTKIIEENFDKISSQVGGVTGIVNSAGDLIGSATGTVSGIVGGASSLFDGAVGTAKTVVAKSVAQTIERSNIDSTVKDLIGNAKVQLPNFTGVISAEALRSPLLTEFKFDKTEFCSCSDPTLISPTKEECEAAGGTWICTKLTT